MSNPTNFFLVCVAADDVDGAKAQVRSWAETHSAESLLKSVENIMFSGHYDDHWFNEWLSARAAKCGLSAGDAKTAIFAFVKSVVK